MSTFGEVLAYRHLIYQEGERLYETGQHGARMWGDSGRQAHLTYVDHSGHLIMMPCELDEHGFWYPMGQIVRVGRIGPAEVYPVVVDFKFSPTMLTYLNHARARWASKLDV